MSSILPTPNFSKSQMKAASSVVQIVYRIVTIVGTITSAIFISLGSYCQTLKNSNLHRCALGSPLWAGVPQLIIGLYAVMVAWSCCTTTGQSASCFMFLLVTGVIGSIIGATTAAMAIFTIDDGDEELPNAAKFIMANKLIMAFAAVNGACLVIQVILQCWQVQQARAKSRENAQQPRPQPIVNTHVVHHMPPPQQQTIILTPTAPPPPQHNIIIQSTPAPQPPPSYYHY